MGVLDDAIVELRKIEPYWDRCFPCQHRGVCCMGADIVAYDFEWKLITNQVYGLQKQDKDVFLSNITSGSLCVFRSENKCLIHRVRPENCRYTPFQYVVTPEDELCYSMVSNECTFRPIKLKVDSSTAQQLRTHKFSQLENYGKKIWYLSLNYLVLKEGLHDGQGTLASEWLRSLDIEPLMQ